MWNKPENNPEKHDYGQTWAPGTHLQMTLDGNLERMSRLRNFEAKLKRQLSDPSQGELFLESGFGVFACGEGRPHVVRQLFVPNPEFLQV